MKTLVIDGIIGWDVFATDIRAEIKSAAGEDLTIEINSPGGSVTEGIAIYNAIKAYAGNKVTRIVGLAASMGSYIALASDRVIAEKNAIYMVHNAGMIAMGDHKTLRKAADIIEGMSKILARAYIDKTGKSVDEIRAMMDNETWLYGEEIQQAGFADEIEGGEKGDKAEAVAMSRVAVSGAVDLLKRVSIDSDVDKAAACVLMQLPRGVINTESGVAVQQAAGPKEKKGVNKMTKEQILAEAPEVAEALRAEGRDAEKKRVASLSAWKGQNADADKVVDEAIASGKVIDDVMAQVVSAVARGNTKQANGDNAPDVVTAAAVTASGVVAGLDETDRAAQAIFGYSDEDAKRYKEKEAK